MSQALTVSTVPGILKELYDDQKVQFLTYKDNPFLAFIKKVENFGGKYYPNPVVYGLTYGGASATFSNAYSNQNSPNVAEFLVTRVADFALATIDGQLLNASMTNPAAFIEGAELMIDAAYQTATNRLSSALFRNGAGTVAQIQSVTNVSGTNYLVTLANVDDATQIEIGMLLISIQNQDGSGTAPTDTGVVTAINRSAGTFNVTSSTNVASNWPTNYWLAQSGDLPTTSNNNYQPTGSTGSNSLLKIAGLAAWTPISPPSGSDSFFGVNRSLDTQRLSGVSFNASNLSIEEGLLQGTGRVALNGGRVDTGLMSYASYTALITSLGSKIQYVDAKVGEIGFRGVLVNGANTQMNCWPDRSAPDGIVYALESDSWVLRSEGSAPMILKYLDEIEILRVPGSDSAELRVGSYCNSYTTRPGHNGVIQIQLQEF